MFIKKEAEAGFLKPGGSMGAQGEAVLGIGSKVVGTLSFTGPVQVDGEIEGEVNCKDKMVIGQSAVLKAKVSGVDVVVLGTVNGDIIAAKSLALKKPAKVLGNISAEQLSIEEGVIFEGNCSMKAVSPKL